MITLITGAPGTGKTAAVVSMLRDFLKDRLLYVCNLDGLTIPHHKLESAKTWHTDVPDGAVIVIDEVQEFWPPRGPGQQKPEWIAKLETHRHRGLDLYIITQGPNLIDSNVRALVGRHVHLRELGILGRWWYEWPECADNCRTGWKNAPIKKKYRLPKAIFKDYKSASVHIKPKRSVPIMLGVLVAAVAFFIWKGVDTYQTISARLGSMGVPGFAAPKPEAKPVTPTAGGVVSAALTGSPSPPASAAQGNGQARVIDDRVDWIPRVSYRPESAPAYDGVRTVALMPRVAGALVMGKRVRCVTQQGTDAGLTEAECRQWMANPPFDPYGPPKGEIGGTPAVSEEKRVAASDGPAAPVLIEGPGHRDPFGARSSKR